MLVQLGKMGQLGGLGTTKYNPPVDTQLVTSDGRQIVTSTGALLQAKVVTP